MVKAYFLFIAHSGCYNLVTSLRWLLVNPTLCYQYCSPVNLVTSCIFNSWINGFNHLYSCSFIHVYWLQYHSMKQQRIKWQRSIGEKIKLNNSSKMLSLKNFDVSSIAGNSITYLEAFTKFYMHYISIKIKLISFWWKFICITIFLNHRK